jgi:hypothetical protein
LISQDIENHVVDSSSIETNWRKKQVKTDRIDAEKLVVMLMRNIVNGEKIMEHRACSERGTRRYPPVAPGV